MTVSKAAPINAAKASRPARKEPADAAVESTALQLGELSEHLGYALKRASPRLAGWLSRKTGELGRR